MFSDYGRAFIASEPRSACDAAVGNVTGTIAVSEVVGAGRSWADLVAKALKTLSISV